MAGVIISGLNSSEVSSLRSASSGIWFVYDPQVYSDCPHDDGISHVSVLISIRSNGIAQILIDVESVSENNQGIWVSYQGTQWKKIL